MIAIRSVPSKASRFFPLVLLLFVGSGCSALIYEVIWLQLFQLVIGSSAASLAVLLGTFMGGMCLGRLLLPRCVSALEHPLRVYAVLEMGTGAFALLVLFGMPYIEHVYIASVGYGIPGILLRSVAAAICLLPPTALMGATLPVMSRWIQEPPEQTQYRASQWGFFYGGNIAGGVFGCLLAGFYLLRLHDMAIATYVGAAINFAVAALSFLLAGVAPFQSHAPQQDQEPARAAGSSSIFVAVALSGLCALGAEVVWTRLLSLMLGATVYTFSIILAVFLVGLGLGSSAGSVLANRESADSRRWFMACQIFQALTILWAAIMIADVLPYWPGNVNSNATVWVGFLGDIARCAIAILPSAFLWGASFPLALAGVASGRRDSGRLVGEVYAANTVGAILGSLGFSLIFIPQVGTRHSEQILIGLSMTAALVLGQKLSAKLTGGLAIAALLAWSVPAIPWKLVGFGRRLPTTVGACIAYSKFANVTTYFHVSGKVEASAEPEDMRLQRLLGHLPALLHPHPHSVLVVGCGAGVTAGTFVVHPEVEHITICEIEPLIPPASARYFSVENHGVVHDPRTRIVYDDARHFVLTSREKFDIITSDPIHPWVKGIAPLYSTEYFQLCRQHLNPGGFVTQWVPLYESSVETVQSELSTFFRVFPQETVWGNLNTDGSGYDVVLLGQDGPLTIDLDSLQQRVGRAEYIPVMRSLRDVGYNSTADLLATYAVRASDLREWLRNAQISRDRNLRLQYLAGMGLNQYLAPQIYRDMLNRSTFPRDIFAGSEASLQNLRSAMAQIRAQ